MMDLRKRLADNTKRRVAALRHIIELLANGDLQAEMIRLKMHISASGCRKYLSALSDGGIVQMVGRAPFGKTKILGQPIYRLIATSEQIEQFLRAAAGLKPKAANRPIVAPGRLIHHLSDDAPFPVACSDEIVTRDPFALPVEFFRSTGGRV